MQQIFDRVGALVVAQQHRRLVGIKFRGFAAGLVFLAGTVKALDGRVVERAADPAVRIAELEFGELR